MTFNTAEDLTIVEALGLLTPYDVDKTKQRIGPVTDGAYVLLAELLNGQPVFSYGINGEYNFDIELANRGHTIFMFDHTIDGIQNPENDVRLRWFKEGVGGEKKPAELLNTIENHLATHAAGFPDVILKMDVEGAEYEALDALPFQLLPRFSQIVCEIHGLQFLPDPIFRARFARVFSRINRFFTLFHVHANNFDGDDTFSLVGGVPVPTLIELSFVRSDLVSRRRSETLYPTPLDRPNVHPREKKLWSFPFLPTGVNCDFVAADRRIELLADARKR